MIHLGRQKPGSTVVIPFQTFDSNDPSASVTITGLAVTDVEVYRDGDITAASERASDAGYTLIDTDGIDLDGITGIHGLTIDLSDNTTAGFWRAGAHYTVIIASITVDAATINFIPVTFEIGYEGAFVETTIETVTSQTALVLPAAMAPPQDDVFNGCTAIIHDVATADQWAFVYVTDYAQATRTITLAAAAPFTVAATDNISFYPPSLQPVVAGNRLDVTATGAAGIDWGNIENPTTAVDLSGTDIQLADTVTTLTGHTAQTGDSFARLGAPAGASVSADVAAIEAQTDDIGAAGVGLTAIPWNAASWDGAVDARLAAIGLDHLVAAAVTGTDVVDNSIVANLVSSSATADWDSFQNTTESLQALRDRGDAAWTTGGGTGLTALASGTAQAGTASTIQLAAASTFADDELNGTVVNLTGGTGAGQSRVITDYAGGTDTATVYPNWATNPDATSTYEVVQGSVNLAAVSLDGASADNMETLYTNLITGTAQAGAAGSITLAAAEPYAADELNGATVHIVSGTGAGQSRVIHDYGVVADRADVAPNWTTNPDATSVYVVFPTAPANTTEPASVDVVQWNGTAVATPTQAGVPEVDITFVGGVAQAFGAPSDLGGGATFAANNSDMAGATFATGTDSLEAIRNRGDAAWTTGSGTGLTALATGTAQAGTASTIQLAAGETFADDELNGNIVKITGGTGAGQSRVITDYAGTTDTATIYPNWATNPDATSTYEVVEGSANLSVLSLDGTAADNAEAFFDGTGYAGTGNVIPTVTDVTNQVTADMTAISGDTVAANNAESFFDGTGYAGTNNVIPSVTTVTGNVNGSVGSVTGAVGSVTAQVSADVTAISGSTPAADNLEASSLAIITGSASGTPTTTSNNSDLSGYLDDELIGRVIVFTSGTAAGQAAEITDYASASGVVTYAALTTAAASGDNFVIV